MLRGVYIIHRVNMVNADDTKGIQSGSHYRTHIGNHRHNTLDCLKPSFSLRVRRVIITSSAFAKDGGMNEKVLGPHFSCRAPFEPQQISDFETETD